MTCAGYAECCISTYASLCQAVTTCARYVDYYISTYASCDDLWRVCKVLYFYLCEAVTTNAEYVDFIFRPTSAMTTLKKQHSAPGTDGT